MNEPSHVWLEFHGVIYYLVGGSKQGAQSKIDQPTPPFRPPVAEVPQGKFGGRGPIRNHLMY